MTDNDVQRLQRGVDDLRKDQAALHSELAVAKAILERIEGHLATQNGRIGKTEAAMRSAEKRLDHMDGRADQADRTATLWRPSVPAVISGVLLLLLGMLLRSFV